MITSSDVFSFFSENLLFRLVSKSDIFLYIQQEAPIESFGVMSCSEGYLPLAVAQIALVNPPLLRQSIPALQDADKYVMKMANGTSTD